MSSIPMSSIPMSYFRGGTSKALFLHEKDIPAAGPERDAVLKRLMGTPDPMQIDGLGGTHIVTSKIAIIRPSSLPDVDVDYTFCQVGIQVDEIHYNGNCGNISAAVGPFAIMEGLVTKFVSGSSVDSSIQTQKVRIYNTGTKKILEEHVPVDKDGKVIFKGDYTIDGCPGSGAPILIDCKDTIGGACGKGIIPTGNPVDVASVAGKSIEYTICDVGNIIVFARASDLGINGTEEPASLDKDSDLLSRIRELRGRAAQKVGMCKNWENVDEESGSLPMVALVSETTKEGDHIQSRLFLDNRCHTSMPGTGSVCHAACSRIKGSIVNTTMKSGCETQNKFLIQHPSGEIPVAVSADMKSDGSIPDFETLSFVRTARRILKGEMDVPDDVKEMFVQGMTQHKSQGSATENPQVDGQVLTKRDTQIQHSITPDFAKFIAGFPATLLAKDVIEKLRQLVLDYVGVSCSATCEADSAAAFTNALETMSTSQNGNCTIFCHGSGFSASTAALFNGAFAHSLDFDDTYAPGALHPGVTVLSAAFAQAEADGNTSPDDFLCALAVGYETVCRLSKVVGLAGYKLGFHNTSICGIFGAVATVARLKKLDAATVTNALGLALSKAAGSMQFLENGSWNKRLHAGFAASDAILCVSLAEAGIVGSAEPIEGKYGLLNLYANGGDVEKLNVEDLGHRWEFLETAMKPFPACRMTHGQIELATKFRAENSNKKVQSAVVELSEACFGVVGLPAPNKIHPKKVVDAQFSSYFQTAVALIYGDKLGWKVYSKLEESSVLELCKKITIRSNANLHGIESSLQVTWDDGSENADICMFPKGEKETPLVWKDAQSKFEGLSRPVFGQPVTDDILAAIENIENIDIAKLMGLVKEPTRLKWGGTSLSTSARISISDGT